MKLEGKGPIIGMAVAAVIAVGVLVYKLWPETLPNLVLQDEEGESVTFDSLRGDKQFMVLALFLKGCPISEFSVEQLHSNYEAWAQKASFVGLLVAPAAEATSYEEDQEIEFPVYGLRSATDPYAVNELFEKVGSSYGTGAAVYGGTVVVADADRTVVKIFEKEELREMPQQLSALLE
ncbi:MAG: hypothetical protein JRI23_12550 [Deltaproteobacteria bacterium]|nr:hypothetical protein [Deltaproteobacteria bacterium]MBW2532546.1 hypothetical protein [Deltaproteobacteria bacterium]